MNQKPSEIARVFLEGNTAVALIWLGFAKNKLNQLSILHPNLNRTFYPQNGVEVKLFINQKDNVYRINIKATSNVAETFGGITIDELNYDGYNVNDEIKVSLANIFSKNNQNTFNSLYDKKYTFKNFTNDTELNKLYKFDGKVNLYNSNPIIGKQQTFLSMKCDYSRFLHGSTLNNKKCGEYFQNMLAFRPPIDTFDMEIVSGVGYNFYKEKVINIVHNLGIYYKQVEYLFEDQKSDYKVPKTLNVPYLEENKVTTNFFTELENSKLPGETITILQDWVFNNDGSEGQIIYAFINGVNVRTKRYKLNFSLGSNEITVSYNMVSEGVLKLHKNFKLTKPLVNNQNYFHGHADVYDFIDIFNFENVDYSDYNEYSAPIYVYYDNSNNEKVVTYNFKVEKINKGSFDLGLMFLNNTYTINNTFYGDIPNGWVTLNGSFNITNDDEKDSLFIAKYGIPPNRLITHSIKENGIGEDLTYKTGDLLTNYTFSRAGTEDIDFTNQNNTVDKDFFLYNVINDINIDIRNFNLAVDTFYNNIIVKNKKLRDDLEKYNICIVTVEPLINKNLVDLIDLVEVNNIQKIKKLHIREIQYTKYLHKYNTNIQTVINDMVSIKANVRSEIQSMITTINSYNSLVSSFDNLLTELTSYFEYFGLLDVLNFNPALNKFETTQIDFDINTVKTKITTLNTDINIINNNTVIINNTINLSSNFVTLKSLLSTYNQAIEKFSLEVFNYKKEIIGVQTTDVINRVEIERVNHSDGRLDEQVFRSFIGCYEIDNLAFFKSQELQNRKDNKIFFSYPKIVSQSYLYYSEDLVYENTRYIFKNNTSGYHGVINTNLLDNYQIFDGFCQTNKKAIYQQDRRIKYKYIYDSVNDVYIPDGFDVISNNNWNMVTFNYGGILSITQKDFANNDVIINYDRGEPEFNLITSIQYTKFGDFFNISNTVKNELKIDKFIDKKIGFDFNFTVSDDLYSQPPSDEKTIYYKSHILQNEFTNNININKTIKSQVYKTRYGNINLNINYGVYFGNPLIKKNKYDILSLEENSDLILDLYNYNSKNLFSFTMDSYKNKYTISRDFYSLSSPYDTICNFTEYKNKAILSNGNIPIVNYIGKAFD